MNRRNGFTLIEVLVVVAIIALLVAILIPSLSRAKENSISTVCLSSQHQIGIALRMYAQRSRGDLPQQITSLIEWLPEPSRMGLEKELGKTNYHKVLFCPNDDIMRDASIEKQAPWPPGLAYGAMCYRIGYYYLGNPTWFNPDNPSDRPVPANSMWIDTNHNGNVRDEYACKIDEKGAEKVVLLTDRVIPQGKQEFWTFRHPFNDKRGWNNVVCGDGHAERRPYTKALVRWYPPSPVGW